MVSNMNGCELLYIVYTSSNLGDLFENTKALWCLSIAPVVLASLWVKPPSIFQSFFLTLIVFRNNYITIGAAGGGENVQGQTRCSACKGYCQAHKNVR